MGGSSACTNVTHLRTRRGELPFSFLCRHSLIMCRLLSATLFLVQAEAAVPTPEFVKIFPAGNIAVVQTQQGNDTRLFWQHPNGTIRWEAIDGPFVTGTLYDGGNLVPAEEAALGTPMAAVSSGTTAFDEICLYFVSPLQHPE
ncbi:hypothetical protein MVEN_00125000 [Mycena venus]|uniref:Uncharacterized protein n=1 Tax=Mycena venus TaxID=2733690 RepID=A0A8H6Z8L6_9AGAR|nr:hypothetical protein MVEN_00125000 [Mycena venus]